MGTILLTKQKRDELEAELHDLKNRGRREMAQKIADARSHGDLSENADYDAAKDAQGMLELKINKINEILANSEIVDPSDYPEDEVHILSKVKVKNLTMKRTFTYTMVSDAEADFEQNKISTESPLGKTLVGKKQGETAVLKLPRGTQKFEILEIDNDI